MKEMPKGNDKDNLTEPATVFTRFAEDDCQRT